MRFAPVHTLLWKFAVGYRNRGRCPDRMGLSEARHIIIEHLDEGEEERVLYTNQSQMFRLQSHW